MVSPNDKVVARFVITVSGALKPSVFGYKTILIQPTFAVIKTITIVRGANIVGTI